MKDNPFRLAKKFMLGVSCVCIGTAAMISFKASNPVVRLIAVFGLGGGSVTAAMLAGYSDRVADEVEEESSDDEIFPGD